MDRVILIKYGELTTKKGNRKLFIKTLYFNILKKLKDFDVNIFKDMSRMYIEFNSEDLDIILKKIGEIFGIHSFLIAYKTNSDISSIKNTKTKQSLCWCFNDPCSTILNRYRRKHYKYDFKK